jgi:hypothetical protein
MRPWQDFYRDFMKDITVDVPDGVSGDWRVTTFTVSKQDEKMEIARAMFSSSRGRYVPAGTYKALRHRGQTIMSNTPDELYDHKEFLKEARGRVLINGLGLGVALRAILLKRTIENIPAVSEVTVVELSRDVIDLVGPSFREDPRVTIVQGDAYEYQPTGRYDTCWHDVWPDITSDNIPGMKKLHRKYGRYAEWQGSWCRRRCEYHAKQEARSGW